MARQGARLGVFAFAWWLVAASAAPAATYTVTNTLDSGAGSLRQAILDANANPGVDFIVFNIPGGGVKTILPLTPLPVITGTVSIDGHSQPGFAGSPLIEIGGDNAGAAADGLVFSNNSSQVRGLIINGFTGHGIRITGSGGVNLTGCYIGLNNNGTGSTFPNGGNGILIDSAPNNTIGGTTAAERNLISNNTGTGVRILGATSSGNVIRGNYIGTDLTGALARPNVNGGVWISGCAGNTIGGTAAGALNVIAGNSNFHILLMDCLSGGTLVQGNYIGLNAAGTALVPGGGTGIDVLRSPNTTIGGTVAGARNVVAGAGGFNIDISTFSEGTVIQGNYVGTNAAGTAALGGGFWGAIGLFNVCNVTIGGTSVAARNVISGNAAEGVLIWGSSSGTCGTPNLVYGNYIGVATDGVTPLGNGSHGVLVTRRSNNRIGATGGGINIIAHNGGAGVLINNDAYLGGPAVQTSISANSIFDNAGLGIDLSAQPLNPDGVTPNDPDDPDTGANQFQNYPILTSATGDPLGLLSITGMLDSLPSTAFRVEFFGNTVCDPSGHGEGRAYLGFLDATTNAAGDAVINGSIAPLQVFTSAWVLTATARNIATGDTSEFSPCIAINSTFCGAGHGNCYAAGGNGSRGCESGNCCNLVCDVDPFCCDNLWDPICAQQAVAMCAGCGTVNAGDCFTANPNAGCYSTDCCAAVCASDPFCCDTAWDSLCANAARAMCALPCPGDIPFVSPGVIDVEDLLFLLGSWSASGPPRPRADLAPPPYGDNSVDVQDLLELLGRWGPCP